MLGFLLANLLRILQMSGDAWAPLVACTVLAACVAWAARWGRR